MASSPAPSGQREFARKKIEYVSRRQSSSTALPHHAHHTEASPEESTRRMSQPAHPHLPDQMFSEIAALEEQQGGVEPPFDFEKYYESRDAAKEPVRELVVIPNDEIMVTAPMREHRCTPYVPPQWTPNVSRSVDDCMSYYSQTEWKTVRRKYQNTNLATSASSSSLNNSASNGNNAQDLQVEMSHLEDSKDEEGSLKFRIDAMAQKHSHEAGVDEPDPLHMDYLDPLKPNQPIASHSNKQKNLFSLVSGLELGSELAEVPPFAKPPARQIMFDCKKLAFKLWEGAEEAEPLFCSLCVYDMARKARVSETFYFDFNGSQTEKFYRDPAGNGGKHCVANISLPSVDHWLLVRVERILQGDLDPAIDIYAKPSVKDKDREKALASLKEACPRLSQFRQAICWGVVPLFQEDLELAVGEATAVRPLYRHKTDVPEGQFFDAVSGGSSSSKRLKTLSGHVLVDVKDVTPSQPTSTASSPTSPTSTTPIQSSSQSNIPALRRLNSSMLPVIRNSLPVPADTSSLPLLLELEEFPKIPPLQPHSEYVNNLFVYPIEVDMSHHKGSFTVRNLCVSVRLMDSDDNVNHDGMNLIYSRSGGSFVTRACTSVAYHNKNPMFYDEFKIALPPNLNPQLHLLFTFYHVACQKSDKDNSFDSPAIPVGYAAVSLDKRVGEETITLPVALEFPPRYLSPETDALIRYIENRKPVFTVRTKMVSSIRTSDENLQGFFTALDSPSDTYQLRRTMVALANAKVEELTHFLPVLLTQLFRLICSVDELAVDALVVMADVLGRVRADTGDLLVSQYQTYVFANISAVPTTPKSATPPPVAKPVWEVIIAAWLSLLRMGAGSTSPMGANPESIASVHKMCGFFLEIIFKSIVLQLNESGQLADNFPRKNRLQEKTKDLRQLIYALAMAAKHRSRNAPLAARDIVRSVGVFISELICILDRGLILKYIQCIAAILTDDLDSTPDLLFIFLRIVCTHENYVQLNIPLSERLDPPPKLDAPTKPELQKHFLSNLLLKSVRHCMRNKDAAVRLEAESTFRDILATIELDPRYQDPTVKSRIFGVFLPFLPVVVDFWQTLKEGEFMERRVVLASYICVLKYATPKLLEGWWREETRPRLGEFLDMMESCGEVFEYVGNQKLKERLGESRTVKLTATKQLLEQFYQRQSTTPEKASLRAKLAENKRTAMDQSGSLKLRPGSIKLTHPPSPSLTGPSPSLSSLNFNYPVDSEDMEKLLSLEVGFVILDMVELFISVFHNDLKSKSNYAVVLEDIFGVLCSLMRKNQPIPFISHLYSSIRSFLDKFSNSFFGKSSRGFGYCANLCPDLIKHSNSPNQVTRSEAIALLFLLMRKNFDFTGRKHFQRVKLQTIVGLSKLVGKGISNPHNLRRSLATLRAYSLASKSVGNGLFSTQVEELVDKLLAIVSDSVKINKHKNDPEMVADLYHRIAEGHTTTPDMRVAWLQGLANFHLKQKNMAEAAQCTVHIAALVAESLSRDASVNVPKLGLPAGAVAFKQITPNVSDEHIPEGDADAEEGGRDAEDFSSTGLLRLLTESIKYMNEADLYEVTANLYKLVIPIHEKSHNYDALMKCYGDLRDTYSTLMLSIKQQSRMLGSYYRVGFYGKVFDELDGKEFVYKEPKITRLVEIKDRLAELYKVPQKAGEPVVVVLPDSSVVDRSKLDPNVAHLQITSVTPYFDHATSPNLTPFERLHNLNRFIYETPYTLSGTVGQSTSLADQYKKKTILTVEKHFPYMKKRLVVTSKQVVSLDPIQNSIEAIEGRTDLLQTELKGSPNAKTLQAILQGSVRLQVNAGPQEICRVFMADETKYSAEHVARLRLALRQFLQVCEEALHINRSLVESEQQRSFHDELVQGYLELKALVDLYIGQPDAASDTGSSNGSPAPSPSPARHSSISS
eukprot:Phypoly_transcript_00226.p1 GENE.Phypoly_transcript_00226~~Phypoly_transcript_00226.p1  ORF type:complete len:1906 (-),score=310.18 Phypoly_transcript_00226:3-5720(-)